MLTPPGRAFTAPPEVADELGPYRIDTPAPKSLRPSDPDYRARSLAYLEALREQTRLRAEAALRVTARRPTDALCIVFYAPDRAQHYFWQLVDPDRPPAHGDPAIERALMDVYREVDAAVGRLVDAAGPDATVVLVSDHGFGAKPERAVRVNRWLMDQGLLRRRPFWKLRRKVVRKLLPARLGGRLDTVDHILVDRRRTRAWAESLFTSTLGVWVHVRGRYPLGCVAPGGEYEAIRDRIVEGLGVLSDDGGARVFARVARREDLYRGPWVERAPDVLAVCEPRFGIVFESLRRELRESGLFGPWEELGYTGVHDADGLYLFAGPDVTARGRQASQPIEAMAPTILHLLDVPVPRDMEVAPLTETLAPAFLRMHPVRDGEPTGVTDGAADWRSDADEAQVADHLRALGYLE
jgi:predicted AlkP superfamily phosphohydrolase/phosphomutase